MGGHATDVPRHLPQRPSCPSAIVEISARHRLTPYAQGDFSTCCALYSTINALRLAVDDVSSLSRSACESLYRLGVAFLARQGGLTEAAIDGIRLRRRLNLARHLARAVNIDGCEVVVERPDLTVLSSIEDVFCWIELSLAEGAPVLVSLEGGLDHYTVAAGITSKSLLLFDSSGQRLLRRSSCGLRSGFYQIDPRGLLRIAVHRSG